MRSSGLLALLPALAGAATGCKDGSALTATNGVAFCYKPGLLTYAAASSFCTDQGMKLASPSTARVADAVVETGASTWFDMACPSERGHCNHRMSLWTWGHGADAAALTTAARAFMPMGHSSNPLPAGAAYCAHSWTARGSRWAPKECTEAATGALCVAPACPAGYRVDKALGCVACPSGQFQDAGDQPTCKKCAPGSITDTSGQAVCVLCSTGRAQALAGGKWCAQCAVGQFQGAQGKTACAVCPVGRAGPSTGLSACTECPVGSYADEPALVACKACAAGTFATGVGATSCAACDLHCKAGEHNPKCGSPPPAPVATPCFSGSGARNGRANCLGLNQGGGGINDSCHACDYNKNFACIAYAGDVCSQAAAKGEQTCVGGWQTNKIDRWNQYGCQFYNDWKGSLYPTHPYMKNCLDNKGRQCAGKRNAHCFGNKGICCLGCNTYSCSDGHKAYQCEKQRTQEKKCLQCAPPSPAGACEPCGSAGFKAAAGAHGCKAHSTCQAGEREVQAPTGLADRKCAPCGEFEHKPLAGNDAACVACPLGYKAHADRKSCFAYKCSHIRCKYEEHTCRWGRPDKDLRAWVGLTFHAQPGDTCENGARYTSVRVDHGTNLACATHRADQPWNCRNLPHEEEVCHKGHHCGLGLVSGDKSSCECMPLAAPVDFPTNKPSAFCAECVAKRALRLPHNMKSCARCETGVQRDERKAAMVAADKATKAAHVKLEIKLACFTKHQNKAACGASSDCEWASGVGCVAFFSQAERAEAEAYTRRIEAAAVTREQEAKVATAAALARNAAARRAAATQRVPESVLCPSRRTKAFCNVIHKCGWDEPQGKCLVVAEALSLANERGAKAFAAETKAKAEEAAEKEAFNKAEEAKAKDLAEKAAKVAAELAAKAAAEAAAKAVAEKAAKQETAAKVAAELQAKHTAEVAAKAEAHAKAVAKETVAKEVTAKSIAAAEAAKKKAAEIAGKTAAEVLTKQVAEQSAKMAAEVQAKHEAREAATAAEKTEKENARCHCPNGMATRGLACPKHGFPGCVMCGPTFHLANGDRQCNPNICQCIHGQVATAGDCTHNGSTKCLACHNGYHMAGANCVLTPTYTTHMVGEEGGFHKKPPQLTTHMVGEEGGFPVATTMAIGEEGGGPAIGLLKNHQPMMLAKSF